MSLVWAKISNDQSDLATVDPTYGIVPHTTYWRRPLGCSPSGNYAFGHDLGGGLSIPYYVVDTNANPPVLKWGKMVGLFDAVFGDYEPVSIFNIDDGGSCWAGSGGADGNVYELAVDGSAPVLRYTWTQINDSANNLAVARIFTFTLSGGAIKLLIMPEGTSGTDNPWMFLATKGTPGLTNISTASSPRPIGSWFPYQAFLDDNDDIWVIGSTAAHTPYSDEIIFWRITDVGGSPYDDYLTATMPTAGTFPEGYFAGGKFIGAWGDNAELSCSLYFSIDLATGALVTRDISATPIQRAYGSSANSFDWAPLQNVPPNPDHYFVVAYDGTHRTVRELLPDLTDGLEYSLDDWNADDGYVDDGLSLQSVRTTPICPIYLDGPKAFCSARRYYIDPGAWDEEHSDFYEYYFGGDESPPPDVGQDDTTTIRCWGFSLDDHDFGVFRLGPSETLVVDLKTKQWAEWQSPARDNFRAHVGTNWVGMTGTLADGGTDIVAGDDTTGTLWRLDPAYGRDDNTDTGSQAFTRKVTGQVALDGREVLNCGALTISIALGAPSQAGASISLKTSDDLGQSWVSHGAKILTASDYDAVIEWRGLGLARAPARLFSLEDDGATVRIGRADLR